MKLDTFPISAKQFLLDVHARYTEGGNYAPYLIDISAYGDLVIVAITPTYRPEVEPPEVIVYRRKTLLSAMQVIRAQYNASDHDTLHEYLQEYGDTLPLPSVQLEDLTDEIFSEDQQ